MYDSYHKFHYFDEPLGWSSGPTALWLATYGDPKNPRLHQHDTIYILGFDFKGTDADANNGEGVDLLITYMQIHKNTKNL